MLTLMTMGVYEQGFACLKHIALLTSRAPAVFAADFKHFYCRYNDPVPTKMLKLEIMTTISNSANVGEMVEELSEYVTDTDAGVARASVGSIGKMGVRVPECAPLVVDALMKFLSIDIDHVSSEAIMAMASLVRKYPAVAERIITGVGTFLKQIEEPEAKKALLWMLGEFGHVIPEAPYLLEPSATASTRRRARSSGSSSSRRR